MAQDNSFSRIFKGTVIFGGTELFKILIKFIRGKLVSVLLGPTGMGLNSIYSSSTQTIISFSSLGLHASAVRDISEASTCSDIEKQRDALSLVNQCFYITYALGFLITLLLCPFLSLWSFGDYSHTFLYALLSFYVMFELSSAHYTAVLQGMGLIKELATASITISIATLVTAIPLYYFWGFQGIVPALILGSLVSALIRFNQVRKIHIPFKWHPLKEVLAKGRLMITIGLISLVSIVLNSLVTYLFNIFISRYGNIEDVGFFSAANVIVIQSVSLVFSSMGADYFPRLTKVVHDRNETNIAVNRQAEILCYISMPILGILIVASPLVIQILLSKEFLAINHFVKLICLATAFKAFAYPLGYISWAKGDKKVLLFLEGIYNSTTRLIIYILGYYLGGLEGLGYGICITNVLYFLIISLIANRRYKYERDSIVKKNLLYVFPLILVIYLSWEVVLLPYSLSLLIVMALSFICLKELDKKLNIMQAIKIRIKRNRK